MRLFVLALVLVVCWPTSRAVAAPAAGPPVDHDAPDLAAALRGADLTGTPEGAPAPGAPPGSPASPPAARSAPDYDGRPEPPPDAADVLVWVPRGLLLPVRLSLDYLVRRPLVAVGSWVEHEYVVQRALDALSWDDGRAMILPRLLVDFGFDPHVGATLRWWDIVPGHDLRVAFSAWNDVLHTHVGWTSRMLAEDSLQLGALVRYQRRADNVYVSPGPEPLVCSAQIGCRYFSGIFDTVVRGDFLLDDLDRFALTATYRNVQLSARAEEPSIPEPLARRLPGFPDYQLFVAAAEGVLDTRDVDLRFVGQSGVRLQLGASFAVDPANPRLRFVRYGGEATGYWNVGFNNVLGATLYAAWTENVSGRDRAGRRAPIPFTEKVLLGGLRHMPGLTEGRVRGNDAWVASLHYTWPIWWAIDARLFADLGAAVNDMASYEFGDTYFSYGLRLRRSTLPGTVLEAVLALGTSRFDRPGGVHFAESVRLTLGINHGL